MPLPLAALTILEGYESTQDRWSVLLDGRRVYRPERAALHGQVLERHLSGSVVQEAPTALVIAGGPATGKTTLRATLELPDAPVVLDADELKLDLPEYEELRSAGVSEAAAIVHEESSDLARLILRRTLAERRSLVLDTVGDSEPGTFVAKLAGLRGGGYGVDLVYAEVPVEMAVSRAAQRGAETGRVVPEVVVRELHREVAARFDEVLALPWLRRLRVYDMAGDEPRLILERDADTSLTVVHDSGTLEAFRAKATA